MNDWLDYKGSGSSRAYMGDTISHGLFGIQTKKDKAEADRRLLNEKKEQLSSLEIDLRNAWLNSEACTKKIVELENKKKKLDQDMAHLDKLYKDARQTSPLKAHESFAAQEYEFKKKAEALNDKINTEKQNWSEYSNLHSKIKSKMIALQQEIIKLEKSLSR